MVRVPGGGRKWIWGKTKREAEERAAEQERQLQLGLDPQTRNENLRSFIDRFLEFIKPDENSDFGVAPSTHQDYRYLTSTHILPLLGSRRVRELTTRDVDYLLKSKSDSGLSSTTVQYIHRVLRRALNFAVDWGLIERNPASARMRTAKRHRPQRSKPERIMALSPEQCEVLLKAATSDKHACLIVTALTTGARPGELLALQWGDVDFRGSKILGWAPGLRQPVKLLVAVG